MSTIVRLITICRRWKAHSRIRCAIMILIIIDIVSHRVIAKDRNHRHWNHIRVIPQTILLSLILRNCLTSVPLSSSF